jgi:hypothetical protein
MTKMKIKSVVEDFRWVMKVLSTVETKSQLDTTLNCYKMWINKHLNVPLNEDENRLAKTMKSEFWAKFKNKNSKIEFSTL